MVEHWRDKYEKDVDQKQTELNILTSSKAKDLDRLKELTKLVCEYFYMMQVETVTVITSEPIPIYVP